nr:chemotaxis protein [Rhodospirillales bacterium]
MKVGQVKSQFVAVASIAAELSAVMGVAKEISLAAA